MAPTAPNSVLEVHPFMIDRETGLWIYNKMNEIRDFEETAWTLFTENKLRGSVHLYTGEEAVAASVCAQLTDEDYIASTHRGHGHCIAKGAELDRALAELMGKATGYCKGRSGSMHIADFSKGNLGANAIVGGGIPIATGGRPGPSRCRTGKTSPWPSSVTAPPTRAPFTSPSTWRRCGSCR